MTPVAELRTLLEELNRRPLVEPELQRRRLPPAASRFIQRKIKVLHAEGRPIKQAVAMAYQMARRKGLL